MNGIAIPKSMIGKVLIDSCREKLLWNATLPCSYTYACLKNCVCASKECDIVRICNKANDFYPMSILLVEIQAA